jgi:DNA-binding MarR family transcriptional regulator
VSSPPSGPQLDARRGHRNPADVGARRAARGTAGPAAGAPDDRRAAAQVAYAVGVLTRAGHTLRAPARSDAGRDLRWSRYPRLAALIESGPQRVTDLAEAPQLSASSVSRTAAQLISEGLVERTADAGDGRACRLVATAHGHQMHDRMIRDRDDAITQALADWPDADQERLAVLLRRLLHNLGLAEARPFPHSTLGSS